MTRTNRPTREHRDDSTDRDDPTTDRRAAGRTLADVSHTHPYGDHGAITRPFQRGPVVAADGGRREARDEDDDPARMRDVDHTPPYGGGEEVDRVFERGGREEPVESEE